VAEQVFGSAIVRYVDRAWSTEDQKQRLALCDLAIQDNDVITAHAQNRKVIGGRYRTRFCSAFLVRLPVRAEAVVDVCQLQASEMPEPDFTLDNILLKRTLPKP
jgi:hypothetical protein